MLQARKQLAVYHNNRAASRWNLATGATKDTPKEESLSICDEGMAEVLN